MKPNQELSEALGRRGIDNYVVWCVPGPKGTGIAWFEGVALGVGGSAGGLIVETHEDGTWTAWLSPRGEKTDAIAAEIATLVYAGDEPNFVPANTYPPADDSHDPDRKAR